MEAYDGSGFVQAAGVAYATGSDRQKVFLAKVLSRCLYAVLFFLFVSVCLFTLSRASMFPFGESHNSVRPVGIWQCQVAD